MDKTAQAFRRSDPLDKAFLRVALLSLVLFLIAFPSAGYAVVTTAITSDGTLPTPTTVTQNGNVFNITNGTRPGNGLNLFHSFGLFSVGPGDIANFLNQPTFPTTNIIGRVTTAGAVSNIFGTIQTNGIGGFGNANLFLINPAGWVFGPTASLNVGGAVSFTTAQYIRLFDGVSSANFYANPANDGLANSVLAVAPVVNFGFLKPAAYGFLTAPDPSATITVQGSALSVPLAPPGSPPNSISLVGGNISIQGFTRPDGTVQPAQLSAPNGRVQLASTASPGEFDVATLQPLPNVDGTSFTSFGSVSLAPGSSIDVSGARTVFIKGGQLVLSVNDATLTTSQNPAPLDTISLSQGSSMVTSTSGAEPGPDVQITVGTLSLDGAGTAITTQASGTGNGGNITANANTMTLTKGAAISSSTSGLTGGGSGGEIQLAATSLSLDGAGTKITTQASRSGNGGSITANADTMTLTNRAVISSSTSGATGGGSGGEIQVTATSLGLDGLQTGIMTQTSADIGNGGNITANVGTLSLSNSARIASTNSSRGNGLGVVGQGGNVTVQGLQGPGSAADSVTLSNRAAITTQTVGPGSGGEVSITAGTLTMENAGSILTANVSANGVGGNLVLNVGTLNLLGGPLGISDLHSLNFSSGTGLGGNVTVQGIQGEGSAADSVMLSGGSRVFSETDVSGGGGGVSIAARSLTMMDAATTIKSTTLGTGRGGDIVVSVEQLSLSGGATITSHTVSAAPTAGAAGNVTVQGLDGPGSKAVSVAFSGQNSGIVSDSFGDAAAGDIKVDAGTLALTSGAVISAGNKLTTGSGGNVTVDAGSVDISGGSSIFSEALGKDAGQVKITANALTLNNGTIKTDTSSITGGRGGNVVLDVGNVSLSNGAQINSSTANTGQAGDITMKGNTLTLSNGSRISSASTGTKANAGNAGSVTITDSGNFTSDASTVATSAENAKGGNISISAQGAQLLDGTLISANSNAPLLPNGAGDAGNITITSATTLLMQNSSVTTEASHASGGQIRMHAPDMVQLTNSHISTSVAGSASDTHGGDISIDPNFVILQNSQILAKAFAGTGGNITITAGVFLADPNSLVDASSLLGISGSVEIRSPVSNVAGIVGRLPESVLAARELLRAACAARVAGAQISSFVERGRDNIPSGPDDLLATPYLPPSSEPSSQMGAVPLGSGSELWVGSFRTSGVQVRRLIGPDPIPRVQLLSDDIACGP